MKILIRSNLKLFITLCFVVLGLIGILIFGDIKTIIDSLKKSDFFISALASFLSALVLALIVFVLFRPRVAISPKIAKRVDPDTNTEYYSFKFINTSIFSAFEVNVEAYVCYKISATNNGKGMNITTKKVPLRRSKWIYIANWRNTKESTPDAPHCMIVSTNLDISDKENYVEDIKQEIESNSNYLEFRVTLKHSFSNLSSTYREQYNTSDCVKTGKFKFGNSLEIV